MNVSLTKELTHYIQCKLDSGRYTSASEIVREGLRLLQEKDQLQQIRIQQLRREVDLGWQQSQSGHYKDGPWALRDIMQWVQNRPSKARRTWK